jgi:hypothetical protein
MSPGRASSREPAFDLHPTAAGRDDDGLMCMPRRAGARLKRNGCASGSTAVLEKGASMRTFPV